MPLWGWMGVPKGVGDLKVFGRWSLSLAMAHESMPDSSGSSVMVTAGAWGVAVAFGLLALTSYGSDAGAQGDAPVRWPTHLVENLGVERDAHVFMTVHPLCPCTRASIRELARVAAETDGALRATVLFYEPTGQEWPRSDLWQMAEEIPGVRVVRDVDGVLAEALGGRTSGHVVAYDANGRLRYQGGVTGARGHEGDNAGRAAIVAMYEEAVFERTRAPVFGCNLENPERGRQSDE